MNIQAKEEIAISQAILLLQQCFHKFSATRRLKLSIGGIGLKENRFFTFKQVLALLSACLSL
jgi:hypothetical protein